MHLRTRVFSAWSASCAALAIVAGGLAGCSGGSSPAVTPPAQHAAAVTQKPAASIIAVQHVERAAAATVAAKVVGSSAYATPLKGQRPQVLGNLRRVRTGGPNDLSFYGGPTLTAEQSYDIYVNCGSTCWGGADPGTFLVNYGASDMIHIVDQYTNNAAPNRYTYGGGITLNYDTSHQLSDQDIYAIVHSAAAAYGTGYGKAYHVFLQSGVAQCSQSAGGCYAQQYCAYHGNVNFSDIGHVIYSVEPYQGIPGCQAGSLTDSTASTLSHELTEAITDPDVPGNLAWYNNSRGEIGDICRNNYGTVTLNGTSYYMQQEYSNAVSACTFSPPTPPAPPPSPADLYAIVRAGTGSGMTEVHALNGRDFSTFTKHLATALAPTGSGADWQFLVGPYQNDGQPDLWAIAKTNTGSNSTEVHILSAATNYSTFLLHTGTALEPTGSDQSWVFGLGDYNHDGNLDLFCIHRQNTGSGMTEVHVLDGTNFGSFLTHLATGLGPTGTDGSWKFLVGPYRGDGAPDVWAIAKSSTGSGTTEVHVLSAASSYASFAIHSGSSIEQTGTDGAWDFALHDYNGDGNNDLYAIKKVATGTNSTEVFVLDGTNFNSRLAGTGSGLQTTGTDLTWEFGESS